MQCNVLTGHGFKLWLSPGAPSSIHDLFEMARTPLTFCPDSLINRLLACLVLLLMSNVADAQWKKIAPPVEQLVVGSDGFVVPSQFTLPNGYTYWLHTTGSITASNTGDQVDAHYYNMLPSISLVGFKVRQNASTEPFLQAVSPKPKSSTNEYFDAIPSSGVPLQFRFYDRNDRATDPFYYNDNIGSFNVEVAQWTPELIVQHDTLDFGTIEVGKQLSLLDSFQAYGKQPLNVTNIWIQPSTGGNAFSVISERGTAFQLSETTSQLMVTAAPAARGPLLAFLHIATTNAFGGNDRVIVLKGNAVGPEVRMLSSTDTIDFGVIAAGANTERGRAFINVGDVATSITGVTISTPAIFSAATPLALPPDVQASLLFTFSPSVEGNYFAYADIQFAHGETKRLYLRGRAGKGIPSLSTKFIDFGRVFIGEDSVIGLQLTNIGDVEYLLESVTIDNGQFSFTGIDNNVKIGPKAMVQYLVTFAPTYHLDPYHEGRMVFTYDNGVIDTVILRGRDDAPLSALLKMDTNYYFRPGDEVTVAQRLIADLELTIAPIRKFSEFVQFDKDVLEFVRVEKGSLISSNAWVLKTSQTGGAIDITISSETERLDGPGKLLNFVFRIRENTPPGTVTHINQVTPNFYNDLEPLATVEDGMIHILDRCDPILVAGIENDTMSFIEQNRPNPFNPTTEIPFYVGIEGRVRIELFNPIGESMGAILDETRTVGVHRLQFDGSALSSGVYTYVFTLNGSRFVNRMHLLK